MAEPERSVFVPGRGLLKVLALGVGWLVSMLGAVAALGLWIDSGWLRVAIAAALLVAIPMMLADRLLPKDRPESARGLVGDVFAVLWMSGAVAVAALGTSQLHGVLEAEAARLDDGWPQLAWLTRWLASNGEPPPTPEPAPTPAPPPKPVEVAAVAPVVPPPAPIEAKAPEVVPPPVEPPRPVEAPEPAKPEPPKEQTPAELFATYAPAVVTIRSESSRSVGAGTGFFIDDKGLIATNHHVIAGADKLTVKRFDGAETDKVELVDQDAAVDLALLRVELTTPVTPVQIGDSEAVTVGEAVIVIGNPLGLEHTLTDGLVSSRRIYEEKRYIQMSAPVSPGNSGGPVFNRRGEVIGVTVAKIMWGLGENLNLAIPVNELKTLMNRDHAAAKKFGASSW